MRGKKTKTKRNFFYGCRVFATKFFQAPGGGPQKILKVLILYFDFEVIKL